MKSQVVANQGTGQIICTAHGKGRVHDFRLFKSSGVRVHPQRQCLADRGYQGLAKLHPNSYTPHKKRPHTPLSAQQRCENRQLAQLRVVIEHVNGYLKRFRIVAERYRNRRRRFGLRFNLIAGIYNYELARSA